jgi:hypothetical protein
MVGEQFLFLSGVYLLSREIFARRSTVILVCLASIGSLVWYAQQSNNFEQCYLFPLCLFLMVKFFASRRPEFLWLGGICGLAWAMGITYYVVLAVYTLFISCAFLFLRDPRIGRCVIPRSWISIAAFAAFIVLSAAYLYLQLHVTVGVVPTTGRSSGSLQVDLENFLSYGGVPKPMEVVQRVVLGYPTDLPIAAPMDNTVYVGLLPLVFFLWALYRVRQPLFLGIACSAIFLILLSFGGLFATVVYHLPLFKYYRHIGLVYALVRILIIIGAGFGLEDFWSSPKKAHFWVMLGAFLFLIAAYSTAHHFRLLRIIHGKIPLTMFGARIAVYLTALGIALISVPWVNRIAPHIKPESHRSNLISIALVVGLLFDLLSFQMVVYSQSPRVPATMPLSDSAVVNELTFQEQRSPGPLSPRQQRMSDVVNYVQETRPEWKPTTHAVMFYNYVQFDPDKPAFRTDWWSEGVDMFLRCMRPNDPSFLRILGCGAPKLRLMTRTLLVKSDEEARKAIWETPNRDEVLVLTCPQGIPPRPSELRPIVSNGDLHVTKFTANQITIEANVTAKDGAWLVYADAWHPWWHATVNGRESPIVKAYMAFKAVWLEKGHSVVKFEFGNRTVTVLNYVIVAFGALFSLVVLLIFLGLLFPFVQRTVPASIGSSVRG